MNETTTPAALRKRQRLGYAIAGAAVLAIVLGFGGGYAIGYATVVTNDELAPPRTLPENVCELVNKETRTSLIPTAGHIRVGGESEAHRITATCAVATDVTRAPTYNEATLDVRVSRFGSDGSMSRTDAAADAMAQAKRELGSGKPVSNLGDESWVANREQGKETWRTQVRVQAGDTLIAVDYGTVLGDGGDTKKAAVTITRQILAGIS